MIRRSLAVLPVVVSVLTAGCNGVAALPEGAVTSDQATFRVEVVTEGLDHPWSLAFLPDGAMLVTERPGTLRLVREGEASAPIEGLPGNIAASGQGGLLDVLVDPDFAANRTIYFSYAGSGEGGRNTEVARARLSEDAMRLEDLEVIFVAQPKTGGSNHYGSRLALGPEGGLFVSLGERSSYMEEAQNPANHLGTIVRLNPDGTLPGDNPVIQGAAPGVYSYGHRNVQGLTVRPGTGQVVAHEHGPRGGDEVNILEPGANYGWPAITYGIGYSGATISEKTAAPGMEQPVVYWDPSIAPSGMAFYDGNAFPEWRGDLFVGALAGRHLRRLEMEGDRVVGQESLLEGMGARIRDVRDGPDGYVYLLTDSARGQLLRLVPVEG